jgi:hypothetical protein
LKTQVGPAYALRAGSAYALSSRGRIEEDQLELSEQVTSSGEECLLDQVLVTARSERRLVGLLLAWQFVAQPTHRPIEVMELKIFTSIDLITLLPLVGCAIAAGVEEPVQNGQEDGPLNGKLKAAALQQLLKHMLAAGQLPEPLEDQGRADMPDRDGREPALGMLGEQQDRAGQSGTRDEQSVELAAGLELIEPSQGGYDPLPGASALPAVLDDLKVRTGSRGLGAEEHGALQSGTP